MSDFDNEKDDEEELEGEREIKGAALRREVDDIEREAIRWALLKDAAGNLDASSDGNEDEEDDDDDDDRSLYSYNGDISYPTDEASWRLMERAYCAWVAPSSVKFVHLDHVWNELGATVDDPRKGNCIGRGLSWERTNTPYVWKETRGGRQEAPFALRDRNSDPADYPTGPEVIVYDSI